MLEQKVKHNNDHTRYKDSKVGAKLTPAKCPLKSLTRAIDCKILFSLILVLTLPPKPSKLLTVFKEWGRFIFDHITR